jgi:dihydrolipoamide dehydrogenase
MVSLPSRIFAMKYDVTVIGSGPGGYIAAIRCAQLGMKTALIEKYSALGGTCLNVGCIPSKALLDSSEHYHDALTRFKEHGIDLDGINLNFTQMMSRKAGVVKQTTEGIEFLMKKNKIDVITGHGSFIDANTISVKPASGKAVKVQTDKVIIATGSKPASLPFIELDKNRVITSTEALSLKKLPKSMIVIGGGVIGLELGSVYQRLGTQVTVIEYLPSILAGMDHDLGRDLQRSLKKAGMKFELSCKVSGVKSSAKSVTVTAENKKGVEVEFKADYALVAVGRKAYTDNLGLEKVGIKTDERGRIEVNGNLETGVKGIYAIGDVIKGAMLAHKAEEEGVFVAEVMAGQHPHINYNLIPGVVYTWPEVAGVGATENELKEAGKKYKTGSYPMRASARARASMDIDGQIKVLADAETDEILGIHMIGPRVADIISEAAVAMEFRASAEDIGRTCHPHPTYSEALKEACLAASDNRALNI